MRAAPDMLSSDHLIDEVWSGRVVSPETLTARIKLLRSALGDHADDPQYIRVIRGEGFQMIPQVEFSTREISGEKRNLRRWTIASGLVAGTIVAALAAWQYFSPSTVERDIRSVAVLPFATDSTEEQDAEFVTTGTHDDLITQLAKIRDLKVISRTSVREYKDTTKNIRQIGQELGVATVLEGSVQRVGDQIHMNVQLVDAETDENLWAETYDRDISVVENIFFIQSDIAKAIAGALSATLLPGEIAALEDIPTHSTGAWEYYVSGNGLIARSLGNSGLAIDQYEQAIEADPQFALAYAALSEAHALKFVIGNDPSPERQQLALENVQHALTLAPDLPEAHLALALYHNYVTFDPSAALRALETAQIGSPGNPEVYNRRAWAYRLMGRWEEAVANLEHSVELDPRSATRLNSLAALLATLHEYDRADELLERALRISPEHWIAYSNWFQLAIWRDGDISRLKEAAANTNIGTSGMQEFRGWMASLYERDYEAALAYLDMGTSERLEIGTLAPYRDYMYGVTYRHAGNSEMSRKYFQDVLKTLEQTAGQFRLPMYEANVQIQLGAALASLGKHEQALDSAAKALEIVSFKENQINAPQVLSGVIRNIYVIVDPERAIDEFEHLLSVPSPESIEAYLIDPAFDPIRDDPRFLALVEKYRRTEE